MQSPGLLSCPSRLQGRDALPVTFQRHFLAALVLYGIRFLRRSFSTSLVGDVDLIFDLLEALVIIVVFGGAIGMPPRCRKVQVFLESFEYLDLEHLVILVEIGRWLDDLDTSII